MRARTRVTIGLGFLALSLSGWLAPIASAQAPGPVAVHQGPSASVATPDDSVATCAQNNGTPNGDGINVQDYDEGSGAFDSYGAADFKLRTECKVTSVRIEGFVPGGGGTATKVRVWIYKNNGAIDLPTPPGSEECTAVTVGEGPNFKVPVSQCKLKKGRYWLAVQVEESATQWFWATTDERRQLDDAWRNPADGFGTSCRKWDTLDNCFGYDWDYLFSIAGR